MVLAPSSLFPTKSIPPGGALTVPEEAVFSPVAIPGLQVWLKADSLSLADGAAVANWPDSSGNGNHATNPTAGQRPVFKPAILNGQPVVRFDGVDDALGGAVPPSATRTIIIVARSSGTGPVGRFWGLAEAQASLFDHSGQYGYYSDEVASIVALGGTSRTGFSVVTVWMESNLSAAAWVNGTFAGGWNPFDHSLLTQYCLGNQAVGGISPLACDIAEFLIFDSALSLADLEQVESYLGEKYGIAVQSFQPDDLSGLSVWLKADSLALADGAEVATWSNESGTGNHATQVAGIRPILKTGILNGKPVVRFDGVGDHLLLGTPLTLAAFSAYFVQQSDNDCMLLGSGSQNRQVRIGTSGANVLSVFDGAATATSGPFTTPRSSFSIISFTSTGTAASFTENGNALGGGGPIGTVDTVDTVGAFYGGANSVEGDIAEIVLYNRALSTVEAALLVRHLGAKYGIAVS